MCVRVYVYMCVCVYVCMYVCMHACMYVCVYVCMCANAYMVALCICMLLSRVFPRRRKRFEGCTSLDTNAEPFSRTPVLSIETSYACISKDH